MNIDETPEIVKQVDEKRQALYEAGFTPVAVRTRSKIPAEYGWQRKRGLPAAADLGTLSTGILCSGLRAVDIDCQADEIADRVAALAEKLLGRTCTRTRPGSAKRLSLYRAADGEPAKIRLEGERHVAKSHDEAVEILGKGQQFVADGEHPDGGRYAWNFSPEMLGRGGLPAVTEDQIAHFLDEAEKIIGRKSRSAASTGDAPDQESLLAPSFKHVLSLLSLIENDSRFNDRNAWLKFCAAILAAAGPENRADAIERLLEWADKWGGGLSDTDENRRAIESLPAPYRVGWNYLCSFTECATLLFEAGGDEPPKPEPQGDDEKGGKRGGGSDADKLIAVALRDTALFHTAAGDAYADIRVAGHRETHRVGGSQFKQWLTHLFYESHGRPPARDAMPQGVDVLTAKAMFDGPERQVFIRVAEHGGRIYLDLCNTTWRAIEIDRDGWRVIADAPVRFRRAPGMQALPMPERGGSIDDLRSLVNVRDDDGFTLSIAWLLAALRPVGPYPILAITGEQGSAKSSFLRTLRALVDPNISDLRSFPRDERDLFIGANASHILAFDNASSISPSLSDSLCRVATGGGFVTRRLYTDDEELLIDVQRPQAINGISDFINRSDLAERSLFLSLSPIPEDLRKPESDLKARLERARPAILGALLDAVSNGLRRLPETRLDRLPRMADFALWAVACGDNHLWPKGAFIRAYDANRDMAVHDMLDADPVAAAVQALMRERDSWSGTAQSLLDELKPLASFSAGASKKWPTSARGLSSPLRRIAPGLRSTGIDISFDVRGKAKIRTIEIRRAGGRLADGRGRFESINRPPNVVEFNSHLSKADGADGLKRAFTGDLS
ncbi:bifunctional DNA primase/polymerase [Acidiphilium sp. PM]|uniref:bifunctional DNA primase/polymerase n=1 Tax=Acidiphilium sp. PM TaxID=1043206 RepID=UPI000A01A920|nr:bifunctional DNA primase/polymerase [Acidiphilium sp. PM]